MCPIGCESRIQIQKCCSFFEEVATSASQIFVHKTEIAWCLPLLHNPRILHQSTDARQVEWGLPDWSWNRRARLSRYERKPNRQELRGCRGALRSGVAATQRESAAICMTVAMFPPKPATGHSVHGERTGWRGAAIWSDRCANSRWTAITSCPISAPPSVSIRSSASGPILVQPKVLSSQPVMGFPSSSFMSCSGLPPLWNCAADLFQSCNNRIAP